MQPSKYDHMFDLFDLIVVSVAVFVDLIHFATSIVHPSQWSDRKIYEQNRRLLDKTQPSVNRTHNS